MSGGDYIKKYKIGRGDILNSVSDNNLRAAVTGRAGKLIRQDRR